ncbi:hypothetical protein GWO43_27075 [candidate division KSB1 bacterium]|nr:hypothetical protein [candidate division KSB1 bacterium]NIR70316.1 hypothetical protein [candidate division KSB1 bacterium]NIS27620.1 hypothetical protein [candidate division KSB1 bacterium]NIT74460.1 hypothetical protein [candidate division KSB1 bacterium]NIU28985.1 hypothetical protein [candidate division KSB1 bacterium]
MQGVEKIEFRRTRTLTEIVNVTFTFIRQNFKKLGKAILFIVGPVILITGLLSGLIEANFLLRSPVGNVSISFVTYFLITMSLTLITGALLTSVVYEYINCYMDKDFDEFDVDQIWKGTTKHLWKVFLATIVVTLFTFVGAILCLLPGIYLGVALSFTLFVLIREQTHIGQAISRSFELVSGHWWFTFGLLFVIIIIQTALSLIFNVPSYTVSFLFQLHSTTEATDSASYRYLIMLTTLIATLGYYVFYAIPLIALAFHYNNLVERKEAAGLLQEVEGLGAQESEE